MKPYFDDGQVSLLLGDCLDVLREIPEASIDAVVCDPPYGLEFMGKDWDGSDGFRRSLNPADVDRDSVFGRTSAKAPEYRTKAAGDQQLFQQWCEQWAAECLRVLKPGGHLLAFGAPRTYHRLAAGIEDAGFEIRDSIHWIYGSGMPKGRNIGKAIDKAAGAQRAVVGQRDRYLDGHARQNLGDRNQVYGEGLTANGVADITVPATVEAVAWEGWNTQLKPAHEPIIVARKSTGFNTTVANVLEFGTGALNVGACRIGRGDSDRSDYGLNGDEPSPASVGQITGIRDRVAYIPNDAGRWPTNIVFSHSPECVEVGERVVRGDVRAGQASGRRPGGFGNVGADSGSERPNGALHGEQVVAVFECAPGCPVADLDAQSGIREGGHTPIRRGGMGFSGGTGTDGGTNHRDTPGGASRYFPNFRYEAKAPASERPKLADGTQHVSVKPLELMRWLVRLVTPVGGGPARSVRRQRHHPRSRRTRELPRDRH